MLNFLGILDLLSQVFIFLGYFSGANSFPKPLKKEEEIMYFKLFNENNDIEAKEKLIHHNLRLVAHVSKKYSTCSIPSEDLLSIGIIGLIKGINSYDYTKGTKFATYGARCIDNEILMAIRNENKNGGNVFLEDHLGSDEDGNNITLIDIISAPEDDVHNIASLNIDKALLYEKVATILDKRERDIITLRYGLSLTKKYTQIEIANLMGISRSYVSRIEKKAIEKLMAEMNKA